MLAVEAAEMDDLTDMVFHLLMMEQSGFDSTIINDVIHRSVMPIRDRLNAMCVHAREETVTAPEIGCQTATNLINNTSKLLNNLDLLLPEGDATREAARDTVALQVRSCFISYINEKEDWRNALEVSEKALEIASSESVKRKMRDDVETIRSNLEYSICWFCGRDNADNYSSVIVMMHGNVERERAQVRWQKLPIAVPRCAACKSAHKQKKVVETGGNIAAWIFAIVMGIASGSFWVGVITLVILIAAAYGLSALTFPQRIKPESHKNGFRTVKEMTSEGWGIGEKPEGVS